MALKLTKVSPKDINMQLLMTAACEGRLFIADGGQPSSKAETISEARAYVQRIKTFVTPHYKHHVDDIWEEIFSHSEFVELLLPGSKARKCKTFDKYNMMRLIGVLRERGVYEYYSDRKFLALLENTDKDCSYRCYLGMGLERRPMLLKIRQIVESIKI